MTDTKLTPHILCASSPAPRSGTPRHQPEARGMLGRRTEGHIAPDEEILGERWKTAKKPKQASDSR
jgi:hypothetical protein